MLEILEYRYLLSVSAQHWDAQQAPVGQRGALYVVDNPIDESDGDFSVGDLSLREAIELANASVDVPDTIQFDMAALDGANIQVSLEQLHITDSLSIEGPGSDKLTIDANYGDPTPELTNGDGLRIFYVGVLADNVSISGLTLTGGDLLSGEGAAIWLPSRSVQTDRMNIDDITFFDNSTNTSGGALRTSGVTNITNSRFYSNWARSDGGAISTRGVVTITNSVIHGNTAQGMGGGIGVIDYSGGSVLIADSIISGNVASVAGGGAEVFGVLSLLRTTVDGNVAGQTGGGVALRIGEVTIEESSITSNQADYGGGVYVKDLGYMSRSELVLANSTVSGNSATQSGGGLFQRSLGGGNGVDVSYSTISNNMSGTAGVGGIHVDDTYFHLASSILSGNQSGGNHHDLMYTPNAYTEIRFNLIGDNTGTQLAEAPVGVPDGDGNLVGGPVYGPIDAGLVPLADNGNAVLTHALLPTSHAIDAGDSQANPPTTDQRGQQRVVGAAIDMGAFEVHSSPPIDGDFDDDSAHACADVDALVANMVIGPADPITYDLNGDGLVNTTDLDQWLVEAGGVNLTNGNPFLRGDANLDGFVDATDFTIWNGNKFTQLASWCGGDFTADGFVDAADFLAWNSNKFQASWVPLHDAVVTGIALARRELLALPTNENVHFHAVTPVDLYADRAKPSAQRVLSTKYSAASRAIRVGTTKAGDTLGGELFQRPNGFKLVER